MRMLRETFGMGGTLVWALLLWSTAIPAQNAGPVFTVLHSFSGGSDGANPEAAVTVGRGGVLYGTTAFGGASGAGTVFTLTPPAAPGGSWTSTVFSLPVAGGTDPAGALAIGPRGALYGTAYRGGSALDGTVFLLAPPASPGGPMRDKVLHEFKGGDGISPFAGVVIGAGGVLYGTTAYGGGSNTGTVFSLTPPASPGGSWTEAVLYSFTDGGNPEGSLVIGKGGVLYGAAINGETVFSLTPPSSPGGAWNQTTLYHFTGGSDGNLPQGPLLIGSSGVLYGITQAGGPAGRGTVFSLTPPGSPGSAWAETVLYGFGAPGDGYFPVGIVSGPGGVIYGCTQNGGANGYGTVFSLKPPASPGGAWTEHVLHAFNVASDGGFPFPTAALVVGSGGVFYGTTYTGGPGGYGTVYSLKP